MLDDTQSEEDTDLPNYGNGALNKARYDWLISELDKGQSAGQLMIIAAHVPIGVLPFGDGKTGSWGPYSDVDDWTLIPTLQKYPNLILWLAGHQHNNQVTPWPSRDPTHLNWFLEVQTASLRISPSISALSRLSATRTILFPSLSPTLIRQSGTALRLQCPVFMLCGKPAIQLPYSTL